MNPSSHAFGFILLGSLCLVLPSTAPEWVGTEGRMWWLWGMGALQALIGFIVLAQAALAAAQRRWARLSAALAVEAARARTAPQPVPVRETRPITAGTSRQVEA